MKDSILKGTGNSRFLKSAIPDGTTWAEALAMLRAGTFPMDLNGINNAGFQQVGTPLNKANLLKDVNALTLGLTGDATPDDMFNVLAHAGDLHVWKKTVKNAADVPAGYTLGAAQEVELIKGKNNSGSAIAYRTITVSYSASITVSDDGKTITLVSPSTATIRSDYPAEADVIKGKFFKITQYQSTYVDVPIGVNFVPSSATFANVYPNSNGWTSLTCSAMQTVTGYAKIPARTTVTYPVSTNRNAYQEGSDAKPAGYTLGEVVVKQMALSSLKRSTDGVQWEYGDSVVVTDDGTVSVYSPNSKTIYGNGSSSAGKDLIGKFAVCLSDGSSFAKGSCYFFPSDATSVWNTSEFDGMPAIQMSKYQPITGYASIPANTTIEYLGCLGEKTRMQVVSYVGTGTYGENNPCSLTFDFPPKVVMFLYRHDYSGGYYYRFMQTSVNYFIYDRDNVVCDTLSTEYKQGQGFGYVSLSQYGKISDDKRTIYWYCENMEDQANSTGYTYYYLALG